MIIGEPNFSASLLPWHNLLFWFSLQKVMFSQVHLNENQFKENKVNEQEIIQGSKSKFVMPMKAILTPLKRFVFMIPILIGILFYIFLFYITMVSRPITEVK